MFTSEEIAEYLKDKEFWQGMWEPRFGDWAWRNEYEAGIIIGKIHGGYRVLFPRQDVNSVMTIIGKSALIPLFTEGQLIKMIEERGYYPGLQKCRKPDEWWAGARPRAWDEWPTDTEITLQGLGPTPIIALMRAVREVYEKHGV